MKFFTEKKHVHKIVIALVIVILFNFVAPRIVFAESEEDSTWSKAGGILFEPIHDLLLVLADGVMTIAQKYVLGMDVSFTTITYDKVWYTDIIDNLLGGLGKGGLAAVIVGGIAVMATAPFSAGFAVTAGLVGKTLVSVGTLAGVAGYTGSKILASSLPPTFKLPMFNLSPEEIFTNQIPVLNVNFFNPEKYESELTANKDLLESVNGAANNYEQSKEQYDTNLDEFRQDAENMGDYLYGDEEENNSEGNSNRANTSQSDNNGMTNSALVLSPIISKWYVALRNLALVALLIILVYIGIRIVISSSTQDKAKYKQKIFDWLIAMCLLFFMHYFMSFAMTITDELSNAVQSINYKNVTIIGTSADENFANYKYENQDTIFNSATASGLEQAGIIQTDSATGEQVFVWPTNLMEKVRIDMQLEPTDETTSEEILMRKMGYTLIYLALVMYTMLFLFRYLKRLLMLSFLTMIAPLMAMTYPIDKLRDGSAQGFNMWFKEYLYNLLIQPVHLLLYTALIGSVLDLAMNNMLYALVALGFILQAEKLLRNFFGFNKASTVEGGSAFGGAMAMHFINKTAGMLKGANKKGKEEQGKIPTRTKADKGFHLNDILNTLYGDTSNNANGQQDIATSAEASQNRSTQNNVNTDSTRNTENTREQNRTQEDMQGQTTNTTWNQNNLPIGGLDEETLRQSGYFDESEIPAMVNIYRASENTQRPNYTNPVSIDEETMRQSGYFNSDDEVNDALNLVNHNPVFANRSVRTDLDSGNTFTEPYGPMAQIDEPTPAVVPNEPKTEPVEEKIGPVRKIGRAVGSAAKVGMKGLSYVGPAAAKFAIKTTLAGAGAMTGIAAGLVSDDYGNVAKWGVAGAGSGVVAGGAINNNIPVLNGQGEALYSQYYTQMHGEDAEEARQVDIADDKARKDRARRRVFKEKFSIKTDKELDEIMDQAQEYRRAGVLDDKIIIQSMQADEKQFGKERDSEQKILLAQLATQVGKDKKELEYLEKSLKKRKLPEKDINQYVNTIRLWNNWS